MDQLIGILGIAFTSFVAGWGIGRVAGADHYYYEVMRLRTEVKRMRLILKLAAASEPEGRER